MRRLAGVLTIFAVVTGGAAASGREACQERTLSLRYSPQEGGNWCWAASSEMVMELLGGEPGKACQCQQAEQVLGVAGCCAAPGSCVPARGVSGLCDVAVWPAFVERPDLFAFDYRTTCDELPGRQDDAACDARPLGWLALSAEVCAGRPVLAALRSPGSVRGHLVVVKGFSTHGGRRVLVVDPRRLCPPGRDCEGELDEGFWISYDEYAAGWDGLGHWLDFYGMRRR
jgi:hypothetical protein